MSHKTNTASGGAWQGYLLFGLIFEGLGLLFDAYDVVQNYAYGVRTGGVMVGAAYALCGFGMALTITAVGALRISWRSTEFWGTAFIFTVCFAMTVDATLSTHSARMGGQITTAQQAQKELEAAEGDAARALAAVERATAAKADAQSALAKLARAPLLADIEKEESIALQAMDGRIDSGVSRGVVETDKDGKINRDAVCSRLSLCIKERSRRDALLPRLAEARSKVKAEKAAEASSAELKQAEAAKREADEKLSKLRQARPEVSITDAAAIHGGNFIETAKADAVYSARLFVLVSIGIAVAGTFVGGRLLGRAAEARSSQKPKSPARPKQASKQASSAQEPTEEPTEPNDGSPEEAQKDGKVLNGPWPKKTRDKDVAKAELAYAAHCIAQKGPKADQKPIIEEMAKRWKTTRSTAQRRIAKAIKDHKEKAQNEPAQSAEPKVGQPRK